MTENESSPSVARRARAREHLANIGKGLAVALGFFGIVEGVLRIAGFEFDTVPHRVELYGDKALRKQNEHGEVIQRHPALFWALVPGATLAKHEVNAAGFIGALPTFVPREGVTRIVCIGDSNVALGDPPYPQVLQGILEAQAPGRFEVINAGVPGYTSLQGLRLLEGRVASYAPDLVTVQYGWNDHWLSEKPMSALVTGRSSTFALQRALRRLRLYQLGVYGFARVLASTRVEAAIGYQVPPHEYREYLARMVEIGAAQGFRVALLTAPGNFKLGRQEPFDRVGFRPDHPSPRARPEALLAIHSDLNDIVREVAGRDGATLVDLEERFTDLPGRDDYFLSDAVHVNGRGRQLIAQALASKVLDEMPSAPSRRPPSGDASGPGRYALADPRVVLKDFSPMEPIPTNPDAFSAQPGARGEVTVVGLRVASYPVDLWFAPSSAGSLIRVSDHAELVAEDVAIDADGRARIRASFTLEEDGVLRVRVAPSGGAGDEPRAPELIAVELHDHGSPAMAGGRVVDTLPFEREVADPRAAFVGGDLLDAWLEVPEGATGLVVRVLAGGQACASPEGPGLPRLDLHLDGVVATTLDVDAPMTEHRVYTSSPLEVAPGVRRVVLRFANDYYGGEGCDRNLSLRRVLVTAERGGSTR